MVSLPDLSNWDINMVLNPSYQQINLPLTVSCRQNPLVSDQSAPTYVIVLDLKGHHPRPGVRLDLMSPHDCNLRASWEKKTSSLQCVTIDTAQRFRVAQRDTAMHRLKDRHKSELPLPANFQTEAIKRVVCSSGPPKNMILLNLSISTHWVHGRRHILWVFSRRDKGAEMALLLLWGFSCGLYKHICCSQHLQTMPWFWHLCSLTVTRLAKCVNLSWRNVSCVLTLYN